MRKRIFILSALVAMMVVGCKEKPYIDAPGDNSHNTGSLPIDTSGIVVTVDEAIAICQGLAADEVTTEKYRISGVLTQNLTSPSDIPGKYSNINFTISDNGGQTSLKCYYINNLQNRQFVASTDVPLVGSRLTVLGPLTNYKGSTPELKDGYIVRIDEMVKPEPSTTIQATCADAKNVVASMEDNATTNDIYVIECYVQKDGYDATISKGQQKFLWFDDVKSGKKVVQGYWCNVPNGEAVPVGTKVRVTGKITKYNGNPEFKNGDVEILE